MGVLRSFMVFQAAGLIVTNVSPGGAETAFWEPPQSRSMQKSSTRTSSPNTADTESTTVRIPQEFSRGQMREMSLSIPLGVSQWTTVAYLKSWSFSRKAASASTSRVWR